MRFTDTGCVELRYADGSMYTKDCTAAENEVARNMYECAEPDYLMNNDPVGYADRCSMEIWKRISGM